MTVRYPAGTPYQGPTANYDRMTSPEDNLARVVYGLPRPLIKPGERMDSAFFGRLFDQLANAHAALVKICNCHGSAKNFASKLRKELPTDLYAVGVKQDDDNPQPDVWLVLAYNRVTRSLVRPSWLEPSARPGRDQWVTMEEAAYVLGVMPQQVRRLIDKYGISYRAEGGRRVRRVQRSDLVILANRPRRWKRRRASTP